MQQSCWPDLQFIECSTHKSYIKPRSTFSGAESFAFLCASLYTPELSRAFDCSVVRQTRTRKTLGRASPRSTDTIAAHVRRDLPRSHSDYGAYSELDRDATSRR